MTSHDTALEAIWSDATNSVCQAMQAAKMCNCPDGDCLAAKIEPSEQDRIAYYYTLSPDVSGLVERLRGGVQTEQGCSHPIWSDVEKADALMSEAADALTALSAQLAAVDGERHWNKAAGRPSDKQGPVFCAVREALDKAHTACFKHPARDVLGMSSGPFSGVNYTLGAVMSLEASLTLAQEECERLKLVLERIACRSQNTDLLWWQVQARSVLDDIATPSKGKDKTDEAAP